MAENLVNVTAENWQAEVIESKVPVLVDFWAQWCGPCLAIAPVVHQLADESAGKLKVAKVNVDENQQLAGEFGIRSIPTLLVFKGGIVQSQIVGARGKAELKSWLSPYL
jgi:thioredoxin 1